jgi:hypothetical protein
MLFLGLFSHNAYRFNWYIFACFAVIITQFVNKRLKSEKDTAPENGLEPAGTEPITFREVT